MNPVIFEPQSSGHRLHFVRLLAEGLADLGVVPTWVTSTEAAESAEAALHLEHLGAALVIEPSVGYSGGDATRGFATRVRNIRATASREDVDWVFVAFADHIAQAVSLPHVWPRDAAPVEGLMLRARFAYPRERLRDAALARASLRAATGSPWNRLLFLDPLATEYLSRTETEKGTFTLVPEPVEQLAAVPSVIARDRLGMPEVDVLLGLVGVIDARKGAVELASAFSSADTPPGTALAFIGSVASDISGELRSLANADRRIHIVDRHLDSDEFWLALCSADILCATYTRHVGSSGIVARAAYLGRPLLSSDYGWVGEATRRYSLGVTVDTTRPNDFVDAVERVVGARLESTRTEASAEFVAFNTPSNFARIWLEGIREELA